MKKEQIEYKTNAEFFQLLAHPYRLQILDELRRRDACVCHLQTVLGRTQAYVSQQLRVLREADVVVDEKDGLNVFYKISNPRVLQLMEILLGPAKPARNIPACPCPKCTNQEVCSS
jgi:DNA-binding transcriptional ArsR family regulator